MYSSNFKKSIFRSFIGGLVFRPYFALRTSWPVWFYFLNREGRCLWQGKEKEIGEVARRIAADLHRDGIAITNLRELFPEENWFENLRVYAETLLPQAKIREGKPFLKQCWDDKMVIDLENPYVRFVLDERVLSVTNAYFEMYGKFYYLALDLTMVVPQSSLAIRSQNWHRDPEDKKMCKMLLYLSDVDEKAGPFQYVKGSHYGGRWGGVSPQRPPLGSYPAEGVVERRVLPADIFTCIGRAGSVIFADTAGLHRGGYATGRERLMFTAEYSTKAALRPIHYRYSPEFQKMSKSLGPFGRYAVDNNFGAVLGFLNTISNFSRRYNLH